MLTNLRDLRVEDIHCRAKDSAHPNMKLQCTLGRDFAIISFGGVGFTYTRQQLVTLVEMVKLCHPKLFIANIIFEVNS